MVMKLGLWSHDSGLEASVVVNEEDRGDEVWTLGGPLEMVCVGIVHEPHQHVCVRAGDDVPLRIEDRWVFRSGLAGLDLGEDRAVWLGNVVPEVLEKLRFHSSKAFLGPVVG